MGTRADFYMGQGKKATWLGSIAWDGYPDGIPDSIKRAPTQAEYHSAVAEFLESRNDASLFQDSWPWPWKDSRTTDYAYTFSTKTNQVMASYFGYSWFPAIGGKQVDSGRRVAFPDMTERQNVQWGAKSGLLVFTGEK